MSAAIDDPTPACTRWKERPEGGGRFAIWLIRGIARHAGRRVARLLLGPITLYFLLMRGPERRASVAYLDRVLGRPARWSDGARHIHTFASTILDLTGAKPLVLREGAVTIAELNEVLGEDVVSK